MFWLNRVGLGFWGSLWLDLWLLESNGLMGVDVVLWGLGFGLISVSLVVMGLVMLCRGDVGWWSWY